MHILLGHVRWISLLSLLVLKGNRGVDLGKREVRGGLGGVDERGNLWSGCRNIIYERRIKVF